MQIKMDNRILIDYILLLLLFPLMTKLLTGVFVHEIMGVGFVTLTVIHHLNSSRWVKGRNRSSERNGKLPQKLWRRVLSSFLLVAVVIVAASGIMVSVVLFGPLNIPYNEVFYQIHTSAAGAVFLLSIVHLAVNMRTIRVFFRKRTLEKVRNP
jgi:hypothetical protein